MSLDTALFGIALGIGLVDLYLIAERGYRWVQRHRGRALVRTFRTRAVELRRTAQAPAHPAPTGRPPNVPVGAPSSRAGGAPEPSARPRVDAAMRDVAASTPQTLAGTVRGDCAVSASPHGGPR